MKTPAPFERSLAGLVLLDPQATIHAIETAGGLPNIVVQDPEAAAVFRAVATEAAAGRPITAESLFTACGLPGGKQDGLTDAAGLPGAVAALVRTIRELHATRHAVAILERDDAALDFKRAELARILDPLTETGPGVQAVDAAGLFDTEPPPPDFVIDGAFEIGGRVLLVGSSKTRKSFASLQLSVCVAGGLDFVGMATPHPRRVLLANLENPGDWQHRRFLSMCRALKINAATIGDRLAIINGRGLGVDLQRIEAAALRHKADVIICDPLYKLDGGADECDQSERKRLVSELESMGHRTGAALVIIHHDTKGNSGDRNIRDRGAGSSIINRDVDCTLALTPWGDDRDPDADRLTVLSVLSRNAPPHADRAIVFDRGAFFADDRAPCKQTSRTGWAKRREPEGDSKADARTLAAYATKGDAKTLTELRAHGTDTLGQRRTRRALDELYTNAEKYGATVHRDERNGRGFIGTKSKVSQRTTAVCQVVIYPTDKPTS
jgi:hypothetical protein